MAIVNTFYHGSTKRYIALFGSVFNKLNLRRVSPNGEYQQSMVVPIAYGPYQKFLARISQDEGLNRKQAISLPRMAFEITGMNYNGSRKLPSLNKLATDFTDDSQRRNFQYVGAPYDIDFSLYVMVKNAEDAAQLFEQILPFFKPEYTQTIEILPGLPAFDVPLIYRGMTIEDIYEGQFEQRRSIVFTLNFTMYAWYFGPSRTKKVIKFVENEIRDTKTENLVATVSVQPGLTANGQPTSDIDLTIPYQQIEQDDDWGLITIIEEEL